jgi:vacuolar iron transporter family protein
LRSASRRPHTAGRTAFLIACIAIPCISGRTRHYFEWLQDGGWTVRRIGAKLDPGVPHAGRQPRRRGPTSTGILQNRNGPQRKAPAMHPIHRESHLIERIGWLRAAVLGANDGIISTASLVVGVAAAASAPGEVLVAGVAGLVAGAMSMAAGEYVSVSSQADTENADLARERKELADMPEAELDELTAIYVARGVDEDLARQVAIQMTARDAFATHARDELGLSAHVVARLVVAALTSAATFAVGAAVPLVIAALAPPASLAVAVSAGSLVCLAGLGALGAWVGGAGILKPTIRVSFWGAFAMAATAAIGAVVGHAL